MRDSFVIFTRHNETLQALTDAQKGQLFQSIMDYEITSEVPNFEDQAVKVAFYSMKRDFDFTNSEYDKKKKGRKEAGSRGATARWNNDAMANDSNEWQTIANDSNAIKLIANDSIAINPMANDSNAIKSMANDGKQCHVSVSVPVSDSDSVLVSDDSQVHSDMSKTKDNKKSPPTPPPGGKGTKRLNDKRLALQIVSESDLPDSVKTALKDWVEYKDEKRQGYQKTGIEKLITTTKRYTNDYGEEAVIELIELSEGANWQGIIWDKIDRMKKKKAAEDHDPLPPEEPKEESPPEMTDDEWVAHQKELIEQDKRIAKEKGMTMDEYYDWLEEENRKNRDGPDGGSRP